MSKIRERFLFFPVHMLPSFAAKEVMNLSSRIIHFNKNGSITGPVADELKSKNPFAFNALDALSCQIAQEVEFLGGAVIPDVGNLPLAKSSWDFKRRAINSHIDSNVNKICEALKGI